MLPTLAATSWIIYLLAAMFAFTSLFMVLVILIQRPKGGGLSGAFGGAGGGSAQAAFGAKVGDVLTWLTVGCFVAFLLLAMGLTWTINPSISAANQSTEQTTTPEEATTSPEQTPEQALETTPEEAATTPESAPEGETVPEGETAPQAQESEGQTSTETVPAEPAEQQPAQNAQP